LGASGNGQKALRKAEGEGKKSVCALRLAKLECRGKTQLRGKTNTSDFDAQRGNSLQHNARQQNPPKREMLLSLPGKRNKKGMVLRRRRKS